MFSKVESIKPNSAFCFLWLKISVLATICLAALDGSVRASLYYDHLNFPLTLIGYVITDLRYFFEQALYVLALLFVGMRFLETRTVFSIGFDSTDADKLCFKGPDADHIVWVGRKYPTVLEAEAVAGVLKSKIKQVE